MDHKESMKTLETFMATYMQVLSDDELMELLDSHETIAGLLAMERIKRRIPISVSNVEETQDG